MTDVGTVAVRRWSSVSIIAIGGLVAIIAILAFGPLFLGSYLTGRITTLFIYVILAVMWNALAGYAGLVSVGQQAFFGLGAYVVIRLSNGGMPVYPAIALAPLVVAVLALALSPLALRLRGGEFAIGMWVFAELAHLLVNLDGLIQGETGTSLIAISAFAPAVRRADNYWFALGAMTIVLALVFVLLRSRTGACVQAIRDNEEAAASVGVRVLPTKRTIFVLAAAGCAAAGALTLSTLITFQPKTFFSVQWTAYMIFMTLVGGLGTFEGPIIGAVVFFAVETLLGATGVWYLIALGASALVFSLWFPRGIWGGFSARSGLQLMPLGYRLTFGRNSAARDE
ncbi:MAG TPA: branched-chain amino acid ABC transporter permease [Candidatus Baltobacteraceae bacterium]|nr:branched-chain amino acid ABC transporter permease [Candidatus Baltobacteraceae bacterium]